MSAPAVPLPDADARESARTGTDRSMLVEASAGTGKTTTLVSRILKLVLEDEVPLAGIVALTFTEKAAAEMRVRLRLELDALRTTEDEVVRARVNAARAALEGAEIGTLHAFAARLLRERPVEAGLDPDFRTPDEPITNDLVREVWGEWVREEAQRPGSPLHRALRAGADLPRLEALALEILSSRALLDGGRLSRDAEGEAREEIRSLRARVDELLSKLPQSMGKDAKVLQLRAVRTHLHDLLDGPAAGLATAAPAPKINLGMGMRGLFDDRTRRRVEGIQKELGELARTLDTLPLQPVLAALAVSISESLGRRVDERKRERSLVDFDDLLLRSRDLLRRSRAARAHFRNRFRTLVVDEFQDTDPVQAEIVLRLAADEPQGEGDDAWRDLVPRPGALFLVGDPKQSIYRFRGADVETYRRVRDRFSEAERLTLSVSFRATPRVLTFVNAVSQHLLVESADAPWEVGNTPLVPLSPVDREPPGGGVLFLAAPPPIPYAPRAVAPRLDVLEVEDEDAEPTFEGDEREIEVQEAEAVAALLLERLPKEGLRFRDAAVLVYRNDTVEAFHEVFERAGIPSVLEGGRSYYRREETTAVITALRAIDDPGDAIALVATLKSFLFGLTDLELVEAREAGARFDDWTSIPAGAVGDAVAELSRLHRLRHQRPLAQTLLELLDGRLALASVAFGAVTNERQGLANLDRLAVLAHELDREGLSFRAGVERLRGRLADSLGEPRAFEEDVDAVRILTVHKSKGLEFPFVVVAEMARKSPTDGRRDSILRYDRAGGEWGASIRLGDARVGTPGFRRLRSADDLRTVAEARRLLYVAITRARQTLVVSWFRRRAVRADGGVRDPLETSVLAPLAFAESPASILATRVEWANVGSGLPLPGPAPEESSLDPVREPTDLAPSLAGLAARRERLLASVSAPVLPPGPGSEVEDEPAIDRPAFTAGRRALEIGIAVHEAMERLLSPEGLAVTVEAALANAAFDLPPAARRDVAAMVRHLQDDDLVRRAAVARRRYVELPLLWHDGERLVEGKIDLLFEEADGWVVVDFKTDRLESEADRQRLESLYAPQLASYAAGVAALLGPGTVVKEARLAFARRLPAAGPPSARPGQLSFDF